MHKNKTKNELLQELKKLSNDHEELKKEFVHWTHELQERSKELNCLYKIFNIIDKEYSIEKIVRKVVSVMPSSWQYPDITCARIKFEEKNFKTNGFKESHWSQTAFINVYGENKGSIEVFYLEEKPEAEEGPFLLSERHLINGISHTLGKIIELKIAEDELKSSHHKLNELFERLEAIREEERKNIAKEIYDEVGGLLTALKTDIKNLSTSLPENEQKSLNKINSMTRLVEVTIQNIRKVVSELSPVLLEEWGLPIAIIWYAKEFESRLGIKCKVSFNPGDIILNKEKSKLVYHIVQELLTNIVFHNMATKINIKLEKVEDNILICFSDNGTEIEIKENHFSKISPLWGIKERVDYWGGKFIVNSIAGQGNTVTILLPLKDKQKNIIRILIADEHPLIRRGLKQIIEENEDMVVADEAVNGEEILNKVETEKLPFNLILLNIFQPDISGIEILKRLKETNPDLSVLVFGNYSEELYAIRILQMGGAGYLTKDDLIEGLVPAIRISAQGKKYVTRSVADLMAINLEKDGGNRLPHETLSDREFEIMCMIASEKSVRDIAEELSLSIKTVSTHKANILKKMNLKNNNQIVQYVSDTSINNRLINRN